MQADDNLVPSHNFTWSVLWIIAIKMNIKEITKGFIFKEYFWYSTNDFSTLLIGELSSVIWFIWEFVQYFWKCFCNRKLHEL